MTDNPILEHAYERRPFHHRRHLLKERPIRQPRTVYRRYTPMLERVRWHVTAWDTSSEYGAIRLFGFLRRERLWTLLETTGDVLADKLAEQRYTRDGITILWLPSPLMRDHLTQLGRATRNTTTLEFVDRCLTEMDRVNRVRHKHNMKFGGIVDDASKN